MNPPLRLVAALALFGVLAGCIQTLPPPIITPTPYTADISPTDFVAVVDNPYFPLLPGARYVYEGNTEDGLERVEVEVLAETRSVMGIPATVVHDVVTLDGELIEDTHDWYAQDADGNVWYLGESVQNYEDGRLKDTAGSWEAGVDGAQPGIIMYADPAAHLGRPYRQEYYKGQAEDMGEVLSVAEHVTVPYGSFDGVVQTKDYTPLEPDVLEHKFYARGIGLIKTVIPGTDEEEVLVEYIKGDLP